MKTLRAFSFCLISIVALPLLALSQPQTPFDLNAYKIYLQSNKDLDYNQFLALRSAGTFRAKAIIADTPLYLDSIRSKYQLTAGELDLLNTHGFVVTERLKHGSFGGALKEIYNYDLPVFVSTDAILHSLHMSYDAILKEVETQFLRKKLDTLLTRMHDQLPALALQYSSKPGMQTMINDVDVFFTVSRKLLVSTTVPKFAVNNTAVAALMALIKTEKPADYPLFASVNRTLDFSQFTVRGHYTETPELSAYFQSMIWLGRTEIYFSAPESDGLTPTDADIQRQTIDAVLLHELATMANAYSLLEEIDVIIRFFVGESDNVTLPNLHSVVDETHLANASVLLDTTQWRAFQGTLLTKSYAFQRINSQILMSDPCSPDQIKPASALMLLGQRFVIDSYVTGNVVYDRIIYQNQKVRRMLPSSLDVLYALGNDAAAQLLAPEMTKYPYGTNLAALRYLVDSYETGFWESTLYNGWLGAIRTLNPPAQRDALPAFMQTAAWWQEKMNTQLAGWAQLRHDNLLYAKQSYSGGVVCSFPESYVEPIPEFYDAIKTFATVASTRFQLMPFSYPWIVNYFNQMQSIADTLGMIARKELTQIPITSQERHFLQTMLYETPLGCAIVFRGWYAKLFYTGESGLLKSDLVVADIHTAPTDEVGNMIGWVKHVGTGPINLGVVVAPLTDGRSCAFIGPLLSYYEHLSVNFMRLTDEEWKTMYAMAPSFRPDFVKLYLADSLGGTYSNAPSLITGIRNESKDQIPESPFLGQNFPNPFNSTTIIPFIIPEAYANAEIEIGIYSIQGSLIKSVFRSHLPAGNYTARWDGTDNLGRSVSTGPYFYRLKVGDHRQSGRMMLMK